MPTVCCDNQPDLRVWLCDRIGLTATDDIRLVGSVEGSTIKGVVGFDGYNGASIQMHVAGDPGWLTRELLRACFEYAFNVCKVNMILGMVPSGNVDALRFNAHLGFNTGFVLDGAHPDGALVLMTMRRGECRFISQNRAKEIGRASCRERV